MANSLAERLRVATGPDRSIDAEIEAVYRGAPWHVEHKGDVVFVRNPQTKQWRVARKWTASLDHATAMVPAAARLGVRESESGWIAWLRCRHTSNSVSTAMLVDGRGMANGPIAIVAACLPVWQLRSGT